MSTSQEGPFFVERNGNHVVIRSKQPFSAIVTYSMSMSRQGALYALQPIALQKGMKLILSSVGHDDVVITPEGDA